MFVTVLCMDTCVMHTKGDLDNITFYKCVPVNNHDADELLPQVKTMDSVIQACYSNSTQEQ